VPRRPRLRVADVPFHVIQRGNNRQACFFRDEDYQRYLDDLRTQARKDVSEFLCVRSVELHGLSALPP